MLHRPHESCHSSYTDLAAPTKALETVDGCRSTFHRSAINNHQLELLTAEHMLCVWHFPYMSALQTGRMGMMHGRTVLLNGCSMANLRDLHGHRRPLGQLPEYCHFQSAFAEPVALSRRHLLVTIHL